jgi:glycosyltransferase involved in cell wall biosynthesis
VWRWLARKWLHSRLTFVIPTMNGAERLPGLLTLIREHGPKVIVAVDTRSTDRSAEVARNFGATVVAIDNPSGYVEPAIEKISRLVTTPWIFRFDDDERPTPQLIRILGSLVSRRSKNIYSFRRIWCRRHAGRIEMLRDPPFGDDLQHRLWLRDGVTYRAAIHTAGFHVDGYKCQSAPAEAAILHFDWIYRDFEERRTKLEFYETILPDAAQTFGKHYLPEVFFVDADFIPVSADMLPPETP